MEQKDDDLTQNQFYHDEAQTKLFQKSGLFGNSVLSILKYNRGDIDGNVNFAKAVDEINRELDKKTTTRSKKKKEIENE